VLERLDTAAPNGRILVAIGLLLGAAFLGQAVGLLIGSRAHLALPGPGRPFDRAAGALAGVVGVAVALWLLLPAMAEVPGPVSRLARSSTVMRAIEANTPEPPDALQVLGSLVGDDGSPQVFERLRRSPDVGPAPTEADLPADVVEVAAASTVLVEGRACDRIQDGTGFVVGDRTVVTNAHVVAGEDETVLMRPDGTEVDADVVVFDPNRDLALLDAPDIALPPLPVGDAAVGTRGAVFGHPGGGPLELSPFVVREEVEAVGRDLYGERQTRRSVLVLASDLAPGDSGAALVDATGAVAGVAFAIAPDRSGTAYALAVEELQSVLAAPTSGETDTGPCLD